MASTVPVAGEGLSIGRVFSRTAGVITDNPLTVFGIAFVFGAVPSVFINWLETGLRGTLTDEYSRLGYTAITLGSMIVGMILSALIQGALVRATLAHADGQRYGLGAGTQSGLLKAAKKLRLEVDAMTNHERADAGRTVKFVGGDGHRRHPKCAEVDG